MIEHDPDHPDSTERWIDNAITSLRSRIIARDAEIVRLRAGLLKCLQDKNECDAWLYGSACRSDEVCICALESEMWINRAVPEEGT